MASYFQGILVFLLAIILLKIARITLTAMYRNKYMPPGPPGLPFLGNILQVGGRQWIQFAEWKERYGPIFSLNLAGQPVVVVNDFTTASDLFDKRSNIYSSRPRFIMGNDIMCGGMAFSLMPNNDLWRRMRRAAHKEFGGGAFNTYQRLHERESALLALRVLQDPAGWHMHIYQSTSAAMLSALYGWSLTDERSDPVARQMMDFIHRLGNACLPGKHLVDILPFMLYLPDWMANWKVIGRMSCAQDTNFFVGLLDDARSALKSDTPVPCFATTLLSDSTSELTVEVMAWLAGITFIAGSETTAGSLATFMLAMVLHPEVMRRAQAQLDAVVGRDRLPVVGDKDQLPYISAIVKEVLRWSPVVPLAIPKRSTQDDWYKGYFIPSGTILLLNAWAANRDPAHFPDPTTFCPERYLSAARQPSEATPATHGMGHVSFGSGKRICVGKDFANQVLFMNIATLLWAFDIRPANDAAGNPILPSLTDFVDDGLVVRPIPFKCSITPRSSKVAALINSAAL